MLKHIEAIVETEEGLKIEVKGDPANVLPFLMKLSPEKSDDTCEEPEDPYEELMPTFEYSMIRENSILESKTDCAGGYGQWEACDRGVVDEVVGANDGMDIRKLRSNPLERPSTVFFSRDEVMEDFYLIREGIRYRIVES